jgi:pyrimidine-nucleoside phosphorylase
VHAVDIIAKKRDGLELTSSEIEFFVRNFTEGHIADYQASAWCMAVLLRGMTAQEATDLTLTMAHSGHVLDLRSVAAIVADKHSTGGVGDKTTLVVAPLVACQGIPVGKMSGRGLSFTGGTIDKLESFAGYQAALSEAQFIHQLAQHGVVVAGQSSELAPADGKLYALRDVTATVESLPLIASSIMSKKIAAGANVIVLDVKVGSGAFLKTITEAEQLANLMIAIGRGVDRRVAAVIADMSQPLGRAVGNALEVQESIEVLQGSGPSDLRAHCLTLASLMLVLAGSHATLGTAHTALERTLDDGNAWRKFVEWITAQGGSPAVLEQPALLPAARIKEDLLSPHAGYIARVDAQQIGMATAHLGAGREQKGDAIDHGVGVVLHKKIGDPVSRDEPLLTIHTNSSERLAAARAELLDAFRWVETQPQPPPHLHKIIGDPSQI